MPNLWTKSTQKLSEAFSGPRTKDTEFDKKIEEVKLMEKGITDFRNLLKGYQAYTNGIRSVTKDIKSSFKMLYGETFYEPISEAVNQFHSSIDNSYTEMITNLSNIYLKTSEWLSDFKSIRELIEKRDVCRKEYDHYDEKLEKMYKSREDKIKKGEIYTAKDVEKLERVR